MYRRHASGAISYLSRRYGRLSINEGGTPVNLHLKWKNGFGFYLYLFGLRLHWFTHANG